MVVFNIKDFIKWINNEWFNNWIDYFWKNDIFLSLLESYVLFLYELKIVVLFGFR